jgi:hypothetical protein
MPQYVAIKLLRYVTTTTAINGKHSAYTYSRRQKFGFPPIDDVIATLA